MNKHHVKLDQFLVDLHYERLTEKLSNDWYDGFKKLVSANHRAMYRSVTDSLKDVLSQSYTCLMKVQVRIHV